MQSNLHITATEMPTYMGGCRGFRLMGKVAPFNPDDSRKEGDAAHWYVQQVFTGIHAVEELIDRKAPNGIYITPEMAEYCEEYLNDIMGRGSVEMDTSHSGGQSAYSVAGRADHVAWDAAFLEIDDFKYGYKIVEPENNWTLISHAIGILTQYSNYKPDHITFRIYQPRAYHPRGKKRECTISYHELMNVLWPKMVEALMNPNDQLSTGEHCYRCPSISQCPAYQIATMNSIDVSEKAFDSVIDNDKLSIMLDELYRAEEVLKQSRNAYEDVALHRLKAGGIIPNYMIESGFGQRRWKDGITPDFIKMMSGVDVSKKALITPKQAETAGVNQTVVDAFTFRPQTGLQIVRGDTSKKAEKLLGKKEIK